MADNQKQLEWEKASSDKFDNMIQRLPVFHRSIAQDVVCKKAEENARERGARQVEEGDIVRAFFSEVPKAFYSLMIKLLDDVGFDYKKFERR